MSISLTEIDWLGVSVGTIAYSAFCGIWHRQFAFGKKWEKAMGFNRPKNWKETNIYYVVPLISCFVTLATLAANPMLYAALLLVKVSKFQILFSVLSL
ncbi:MAG: hypothetical protein IPN43_16920 [Chitinophagaceae bacterium]|nr:hypothetical protein [Chitinophagaceae bacterium]